jgi:hypothetical protein
MTVRFLTDVADDLEVPPNWDEVDGIAYCLGCRREMAGEVRAVLLSEGDPGADRLRARVEGRIEFELGRDPDRCDTRVARACGANVLVVRQVRERLGAYPTRPA